MNLTDLQVELRALEDRISMLRCEIEKMKPQTEEEKQNDFEKITKLAERYPITNRSISGSPATTRKLIMGSLAYLILSEEKDRYVRLLYLCRLTKGSGCEASAEDLYKMGLEFEMSKLEELSKEDVDCQYTFFIEAFILANLSDEVSTQILSLLADVATVMVYDKERIQVLAMIAKSYLTQKPVDMMQMSVPTKNVWSGKCRDYISREWVEKQRIDCGSMCTLYRTEHMAEIRVYRPCKIKKRIEAGRIVRKGETICIYDRNSGDNVTEKKITAPCHGVAFFVAYRLPSNKYNEYIAVYVVSYFDEYVEFKKWFLSKKNALEKKGESIGWRCVF